MPIQAKVHHGTTTSVRLCDTCKNAHIFQGEGVREYIRCGATYESAIFITETVVRCNAYDDKRNMRASLRAMEDSAFILSTTGPLRTMGFISAKDWRKKHHDDDIIPDKNLPGFAR